MQGADDIMRKTRKQAKELLQAARKVYHYRRDVTPEARLTELDNAVGDVEAALGRKDADSGALEAAMRRLDALLRKIGGKIYPKTFWSDNLEVALVATIIVIGVRTFFFQPFIIPTNSMYPTYSGMNAIVYGADEAGPGLAGKVWNTLTRGASHHSLSAPAGGAVRIPIFSQADGSPDARLRGSGLVRFEVVKGRKWFGLLPARKREYTFLVGGRPASLRVPFEFNLDKVVRETFFPEADELKSAIIRQHENGRTNFLSASPVLETETRAEAGDTFLEFAITLGDALFVDRLTYHFKRPEAGEPFVFRTRNIPGVEGRPGSFVDKYYIKRLAGVEGETLAIRDGALYADGEPRDEAAAFVRNASGEGEYDGYRPLKLLGEGRRLEIPEDRFVALGDNSGNSRDSRYWGFVPEKAVVGRAFFIYYPFTERWGLTE